MMMVIVSLENVIPKVKRIQRSRDGVECCITTAAGGCSNAITWNYYVNDVVATDPP